MDCTLKNLTVTPVTRPDFPAGVQLLEFDSCTDGRRDAALCLPPKNGNDWIIAIHGHGSHHDQLYTRRDIRDMWLPVFLKLGLGILTPNLRDNDWMGPAAVADMDALVAYIRQTYSAGRLFYHAGSMGGTANLIYAALRPQNVSGITVYGGVSDLADYIPFCRKGEKDVPVLKDIADAIIHAYGGTPEEVPELYKQHSAIYHPHSFDHIPVFFAQGTDDRLMPVAQSRRFAAALADNSLFTYLDIPGGNHDSPLFIPLVDDSLGIPSLRWIMEKAE